MEKEHVDIVKGLRRMPMQGIKDNPYGLMAILMVFWGSFSAVSKLVLKQMDSHLVVFYFFGMAWVILSVALVCTGRHRGLLKLGRRAWRVLLPAAAAQFLYYFLYNLSLSRIPAFEASMLNYLFPIFIVLLAVPIHKEKLDLYKILSLAVGFAGVLIIIGAGASGGLKLTNLPGDLLALGAALSWGVFSNLAKKREEDQFVDSYVYTTVGFLLSILSVLLFSRFALPSPGGFAGVFWVCFSNIIMTYVIWFRVLRIAPSSLVASLSFFTPVVTLLFIVVLLGEKISAMQIVGTVVLLGGTALQESAFVSRFKKLMGKLTGRKGQ